MSFALRSFALIKGLNQLRQSGLSPFPRQCPQCAPFVFNRSRIKYPRRKDRPMAKQVEDTALGGGVLEGTGLYSLKWPSPLSYKHPAFDDVLGDECAMLTSIDAPLWMKRFTMVETSITGEDIGLGHRFLVEFSPPQCSPYAGVDYVVELRPPESYPDLPPFVRFVSDIDHVLVHDYGDVMDCFYWEANLRWSEKKPFRGFLHLIEALRRMLIDLPNHLVLTSDEVQRLCLKSGALRHLIGKKGEEVEEFERQYTASLPRRQAELEKVTGQKIHTQHSYKPLHPELFDGKHFSWETLKGTMFHALLLRVLAASDSKKAIRELAKRECKGVWSFPFFTDTFCDSLVQEFEHLEASGLPCIRPNSMNKYGVVLKHIGMEKFMDDIMSKVLRVFSAALFERYGGEWLDHHHSFTVQYKLGEDVSLDPHVDDSEITLNVCLGKEFQGGELVMCGEYGRKDHRVVSTTYLHKKGYAVLHGGKHRHGALKIEQGERMNLIVWGRSSQYRRGGLMFKMKQHEYEESPDEVCLSKTHDKDYEKWIGTAVTNE